VQSKGLRLLGNPAVISSCIDRWFSHPHLAAGVFLLASNMPNKIKLNKSHARRLRRRESKSDSVKDLLQRAHPAIARLSDQSARQELWRRWLALHLPSQAAAHVSGVVERHDTLVIFTESAAWSARLRFAVAEIEVELKRAHPAIAAVAVRVLPK
jgi:Dna[CI] antecedent, DciA